MDHIFFLCRICSRSLFFWNQLRNRINSQKNGTHLLLGKLIGDYDFISKAK